MPFKYDESGNVVTQVVDQGGRQVRLPVWVNAKGEERALDGDAQDGVISRLNAEASTNRRAAELALAQAKLFEGLDAEAARAALDTVSKLDQKKLIDAGEIDRVRTEISTGFQKSLDAEKAAREAAEAALFDTSVSTAFAMSPFVREKVGVPVDLLRARFGEQFGIEGGKVYGVDSAGQKIYSRVNHGQVAEFDEAISILVNDHPQSSALLKSAGGSGSGAGAGAGGAGGTGKVNLAGTRTERNAALSAQFPELAAGN